MQVIDYQYYSCLILGGTANCNNQKFLANRELIKLSLKKRKSIGIIRMSHKIVAKDTIDINFGTILLTAKRGLFFNHGIRFKKATFLAVCRGTNGYQPDMRFVFNQKENRWDILTNQFITETK